MSGWDQGNSLAKASEAHLACMGKSCLVNDFDACFGISSFDEEETMNRSVGGTDDAKRALYEKSEYNAIVLFFPYPYGEIVLIHGVASSNPNFELGVKNQGSCSALPFWNSLEGKVSQ